MARGRTRTYVGACRRLLTGTGLTLILSATTMSALSGPALAADQTVTVAPGSSAGPVPAAIGDVILIEGENVTVAELDVPEYGILPEVVVTTVVSPTTVPCEISGLQSETISFSYGSVQSPTNVPEQAVLDALALRPLADATLQVQVAEPPPPPPPPPVPPPLDPPVAQQPDPYRPASARPTRVSADGEAAPLPPELTGVVPMPMPMPGSPIGGRSLEPQSDIGGPSGGLSQVLDVVGGSGQPSSARRSASAAGLDELPMALQVPALLALMSICVVGAGVGRLQDRPSRRDR